MDRCSIVAFDVIWSIKYRQLLMEAECHSRFNNGNNPTLSVLYSHKISPIMSRTVTNIIVIMMNNQVTYFAVPLLKAYSWVFPPVICQHFCFKVKDVQLILEANFKMKSEKLLGNNESKILIKYTWLKLTSQYVLQSHVFLYFIFLSTEEEKEQEKKLK